MDVKNAILKRKSIRHFSDQDIDPNLLKEVISTAKKAPSWVNAQSVRVNVATGDALKRIKKDHKELSEDSNNDWDMAIPYAPLEKWDKRSQNNMKNWFATNQAQAGSDWGEVFSNQSNNLYDANAIVYLSLPKGSPDWALIDLGILAQSIMLAAFDRGIDSLPAFEFAKYPKNTAEHLALEEDNQVIFGIGLGYRKQDNTPLNNILSERMSDNDSFNISE